MGCFHSTPKKPSTPNASLEHGHETTNAFRPDQSPPGNCPQDKVADFTKVVVDCRMPLSVRQCFSLVQSWRAIHRNISDTGVEMFVR